jgi:hypothetical protein
MKGSKNLDFSSSKMINSKEVMDVERAIVYYMHTAWKILDGQSVIQSSKQEQLDSDSCRIGGREEEEVCSKEKRGGRRRRARWYKFCCSKRMLVCSRRNTFFQECIT